MGQINRRMSLQFQLIATCSVSKARATKLTLTHGVALTPMFMPVGTQGTMKGLTTEQLEKLGCQVILANTYHMGLKPGEDLLKKAGGLHRWMQWPKGMLTDSGGFQMVSLSELSKVTEEGVTFKSPHGDGSMMLLTPEKSIQLQNSIGADIIMQLDDVVSPLTPKDRLDEAMRRSIRWLDRCIEAHQRPKEQALFPIIQGGLYPELRTYCIKEMVERNMPGYAIGGLSGGEEKEKFWPIISQCTDLLPTDKPRYCMGVGYTDDVVVCVALGVDMFDCVFPTRTARFGHALTSHGTLNLRHAVHANSLDQIDSKCDCLACASGVTRAHLHMLFLSKETVACHWLSMHNIRYMMNLMTSLRNSILENRFPQRVVSYFDERYRLQGKENPSWAVEALKSVSINLT